MQSVAEIFAASGCVGGVARLSGGWAEPFRYVMPALGTDGRHPAWYSDVVAPGGPVAIEAATLIFGRKDDAPFLHCHGIWAGREEERRMGHMLPLECIVAELIALTGLGTTGALFEAVPDAETEFVLFSPVEAGGGLAGAGARGLLVRVRPNEDIIEAIEGVAAVRGIAAARVHGIGSLNEVRFGDGRHVPSLATELMITEGRIAIVAGRPTASLSVAVVDIQGAIHQGALARGANPVCVTFELVIEILREEPL